MRLPKPLDKLRSRYQVWTLLVPVRARKRRPLRQLHYTLELDGAEVGVYQDREEAIAAAEARKGRYLYIQVWCYDQDGERMWALLTFSRSELADEAVESAPVRPRRRSRISPLAERVERAAHGALGPSSPASRAVVGSTASSLLGRLER